MATILVVDDNLEVRNVIAFWLERYVPGPHTMLGVESARNAVHVWERQRDEVDLIITELAFATGRMRGQELIDHIRATDPDVSILVVATIATEEERTGIRGADSIIPKPPDMSSLVSEVRRALLRVTSAVQAQERE